MNPTTLRLLSQHLVSPQFASPSEVVAHFGAMQAQDYRMVQWAVAMRTKNPKSSDYAKAFNNGEIIRMHLLRGTWQLVSSKDYRWMLNLCAPKSRMIINGWMKSNGISISEEEYQEIREIITETADHSVTKFDFAASIENKGIVIDDHRLSYHIRMAELDGLICSGNIHSSKSTYILTSLKIPETQSISKEEALKRLTVKYFQSHSPATFEDFVWWSGLNSGDCKKGMELATDELQKERWNGLTMYIHSSVRTKGYHKGNTILLSPFDEYLVGYKSREIAISPEWQHKAYSRNGIFYPVTAIDGRICGNWSPFAKEPKFSSFDNHEPKIDFSKQWEKYKKFTKS